MSETNAVEQLQERIVNLEGRLASYEEGLEEYRFNLIKRIDEYCSQMAGQIARIDERVADALAQISEDVQKNFLENVAKSAASQVTADVIADSLTKKVLVTRPAQRHELTTALVTRPAQKHEM